MSRSSTTAGSVEMVPVEPPRRLPPLKRPCVHVLDDDDAFRKSVGFLVSALRHDPCLHSDPEVALPLLLGEGQRTPSALLLDIRMPGMSGLDVHDALLAAGSDIPVIYMTGHGDVPLAVRAMEKGALTFLQKPLETAALAEALDHALSDEVQELRGTNLTRKTRDLVRQRLTALPERQQQVVRGLVAGMSTVEMAEHYCLSRKTVEMYRGAALKAIGANNAAHLVSLVLHCDSR